MIAAPRDTPVILDSNIPVIETDIEVYVDTKAYKVRDKVQINSDTNRIYKAYKDVPAGISPTEDVNPTTGRGSYWFDDGATNYKRAFDELGSSTCKNAESIYYKFAISDIDVLMLSNLKATTVKIKIVNLDANVVLLEKEYFTQTRKVFDWQEWTTEPAEYSSTFYKILPFAFNATLEIWINNTAENAEVGHIAYGRSKNYGLSLVDPKPVSSRRGITSKTRDSSGNIVTRRKSRYRRMKVTCMIETDSVDILEDRLEVIVDTPCIFVGDEKDGGIKALLIYGELKDHDTAIAVKDTYTTFILEIEGYL